MPDVGRAVDHELVAVLLDERLDGRRHVVDQRRDVERLEEELHLAGLDLRQVEDVVDQREQVLARARGSSRGRATRLASPSVLGVLAAASRCSR